MTFFSNKPNPNLYRVSFLWDRNKCWDGMTAVERRDLVMSHRVALRDYPDRRRESDATRDLNRMLKKYPGLNGKLHVMEFSYL